MSSSIALIRSADRGCQSHSLTEKRNWNAYLAFLYFQGSLCDTESWHFRLRGRGPTLALRGRGGAVITASCATEKRPEGTVSCCQCRYFHSRASHAVAFKACENARHSNRPAGARYCPTKGVRC